MTFAWIEESPARWDREKARVLGAAPPGVFAFGGYADDDLLPGQWWRAVAEAGHVVGYGWMDCSWGDGEILLAVDPAWQKRGVGSFILDRLRAEAGVRGINYLYNVVPAAHPDADGLEAWLARRGFSRQGEGRLLRAPTRRP
jgi:GNAT superfamily N-acetyltransferase